LEEEREGGRLGSSRGRAGVRWGKRGWGRERETGWLKIVEDQPRGKIAGVIAGSGEQGWRRCGRRWGRSWGRRGASGEGRGGGQRHRRRGD
jgi:hypothetical protein